MSNALLPVVGKHPFVSGFDQAHVTKLALMAREMCFDTGVVIFPEGDQGREFYLLVHGMVALEITGHGSPLRVQTLHANDEFGWSSVMAGKGKVLQARALNRVDVLVFDGAQLMESFNDDPAFGMTFAMRLLGVVSERLSAAREQLIDMYAPEARRAGT
ncbi:MAG: Crp/Fnr family transcriptional regulator [Gemmatimonadaceae bacterium]